MRYCNNILYISYSDVVKSDKNPTGILSEPMWKKIKSEAKKKGHILVRGCRGTSSEIPFGALPKKYQDALILQKGDLKEQAVSKPFKDRIESDAKAIEFYSSYRLANDKHLPEIAQREYAINAAVLNAIHKIKTDATSARKSVGESLVKFWSKALIAVNNVRPELKHTLPSNEIALKRKYTKYIEEGYEGLISGKFCNDNSRKVTADLERLIMSLYTMPNKPFSADVHTMYHLFLHGKIQVACQDTGEVFNPNDYIKNGQPLKLGVTTVWNYLNQPNNRAIVDKVRSGSHRHNNTHRPHHHRTSPNFAFSKISMDDRDLPRKCNNGKLVKAYYAYDVASGCVIGYSHSLNKDEALFLDCLRNMFRLIQNEGFGMPLEVEVENHLVNKFFDDLEVMFPFVRICNPGNSQEKRAEHFNRQKKYGVEKKLQHGIGRWWSKHEAYTVDRDKVNDEFVEKMFTYERLVADDVEAVKVYNNAPHPNQKKYPGKTRWQVLVETMNPNAAKVNKAIVYKAVGEKTLTSIKRNQYVTVQYGTYQLPNINVIQKLLPGNYNVEAFYLPDNEGMIHEVFLWQNGEFLCKADKIEKYNEARAEWTDKDVTAYENQAKFVAQFDGHMKKSKKELAKVVVIESEVLKEAVSAPVEVVEEVIQEEETIQNIIYDYSSDDYAKNALENL